MFFFFFAYCATHILIYFQHIFGHHPYTNIEGFDPDIHTAEHVSCTIIQAY